MKNFISSSLLLLSLFIHASLQADVLAEYTFTGDSFASTDASTSWSTTDINDSATADLMHLTGYYSGENYQGVKIPPSGYGNQPAIEIYFENIHYASSDAAYIDNCYFEFTVTPDLGSQLTFSELTFDMYKTDGAGAKVTATLYSSIDGFAVSNGYGELVGTDESDEFIPQVIDLSSLSSVNSATTFRIYLDDGDAGYAYNYFSLDNIVLNGTPSVIPEPSSVLLMLSAGLLLVIAGRRRSTK